jgi:signal-transduction protein with cAMP-binding, CBS, and nucleotidyltransferase domain
MPNVPDAIAQLPLKTFEEGDQVIEEGGAPGQLLFLESGTAEVSKAGLRLAKVRDKGAVFGEMSVLLNTPHTATVSAASAATFRIAEDPEGFMASNPDVAMYIARTLAGRLDGLNKYLVDVKAQFSEFDDHVSMVDGVLDSLMNRQRRDIERRPQPGP